MPGSELVVSRIYIKIDGSPLEAIDDVQEVIVDQHAHLPDMFSIRLFDPDLELLDGGPIDLTKKIEIQAADADGEKTTLIKGEITALEPVFGEGRLSELVVRGYDKSHRLYRETKSQTFLNKKDSDLANEIAQGLGLSTEITTTNIVYDHLYQHNQTDMAFLLQRAWRIGYECFVEDDKLYFRKPPDGSAELTLTWGDDLLSFQPRMTLAEQVDEVLVKGWDPEEQKAIVGQAQSGSLYPNIGESRNGASWAGAFGSGKLIVTEQPVVSQSEADVLAKARLDELSGAFVEAEGVAFRMPALKAGRIVKLTGLGRRFSGSYLVTSARHVWDAEQGMATTFNVRGARTGLLAEQVAHQPPLVRWPGVVPAIVTNTDDPKDWGRVKVKFPWMADDQESDWARVIAPVAGPDAGVFFIPDVNDEVMVAFEHGDFNYPCVVGGVWNGKQNIPADAAGAGQGEKPLVRTWTSRTGHKMTMYDNSEKKVEIVTAGGHKIVLDDQNKKLEIHSNGGLQLSMDDNSRKITVKGGGDIQVEGQGNVNVKAGGNMSLEATGNMDVKANGQVNVKGAMVNLN